MFFIEHLRATAFEEEKQLNDDDELRVFRWVKSDTQDRKVSYSNLAWFQAELRDPTSLRGSPVTLMWDCPAPATSCARDCYIISGPKLVLGQPRNCGKKLSNSQSFYFSFWRTFLLYWIKGRIPINILVLWKKINVEWLKNFLVFKMIARLPA